jgi:hypothetical protein
MLLLMLMKIDGEGCADEYNNAPDGTVYAPTNPGLGFEIDLATLRQSHHPN